LFQSQGCSLKDVNKSVPRHESMKATLYWTTIFPVPSCSNSKDERLAVSHTATLYETILRQHLRRASVGPIGNCCAHATIVHGVENTSCPCRCSLRVLERPLRSNICRNPCLTRHACKSMSLRLSSYCILHTHPAGEQTRSSRD